MPYLEAGIENLERARIMLTENGAVQNGMLSYT